MQKRFENEEGLESGNDPRWSDGVMVEGVREESGEMDNWIDHREDKYASEYFCGGA